VKRRELIAGLGSAAAWPVAAPAQPALPVIGFLHSSSFEARRDYLPMFLRGLAGTGYFEGRNVTMEYRWADDRNERLASLATELVRRRVAAMVTPTAGAALAAKAASQSIPIIFLVGADPVQIGLVRSLNRPGGNLTGIANLSAEMAAKRLEMLHAFVPTVTSIGHLTNPTDQAISESESGVARAAAHTLGVRLLTVNASTPDEIEAAIGSLVRQQAGAVLISGDPLFVSQYNQLIALTAKHRIPAIYDRKEAVAAGGLISYAGSFADAYRQVGTYTGRILKGERPADLPVQQSVKIELAINMRTAKALDLTIPPELSVLADEIIE
jgi:putative tryptophan/tyrosine transport system substrate-binding protein